ncbi:MAG TPA: CoA transferase [Burkholderiales bacterium]|nr:CoA transferase [Burkholderiales bacterium]
MVMGPSCGLVLADLGAEVIKVEPLEGDNTRRLMGAGAGFYPIFNRNKKSLAVDLKHPGGKKLVEKLISTADVLTENFRPGALDKLEFGYDALSKRHPKLVYCTLKGFLSGPYEHRPALDEVVQMMGGLAYMTGLPDRPLRVGSSVNDIMGGMFAAIGILAALRERELTGRGKLVKSALFENTVFLVGQHMAQYAITGEAPPPMSVKKPAWGIYDIFETGDDRLFIGVVTDTQWEVFCREFGERELGADARLKTNSQRVREREWLIPRLGVVFKRWKRADLEKKLEAIGLPYAPITRPQDLFDDPHLNASGGLMEMRDPRGTAFRAPTLPLELDGKRLPMRNQPPAIGEGSRELLLGIGYGAGEIDALAKERVIVLG